MSSASVGRYTDRRIVCDAVPQEAVSGGDTILHTPQLLNGLSLTL